MRILERTSTPHASLVQKSPQVLSPSSFAVKYIRLPRQAQGSGEFEEFESSSERLIDDISKNWYGYQLAYSSTGGVT